MDYGFLSVWIFIWLVVAVVFGGLTAKVAIEKGYSVVAWFTLGALFFPASLLAAVGLPDKKLRSLLEGNGESYSPRIEEEIDPAPPLTVKTMVVIALTALVVILLLIQLLVWLR